LSASDPRSVVDPAVAIARPDPSKPYPEENPVYVPPGEGAGDPPTVTAVVPDSVTLGEPDFTVSVQGTGFDEEAVIVWNGFDEPTTFVSATEVQTGVNMAVWAAPVALDVQVRTAAGLSNAQTFTFLAPVEGATTSRRRSR
jgi:hypothetical protein